MNKLRDNTKRRKNAEILIKIVLVLTLIAIASDLMQYHLLSEMQNGMMISDGEANFNDIRQQIIAIISALAYIASGIIFIMWFRRAYWNLHQVQKGMSSGEGMAAAGWFIPILSLFKPYKIFKEMFDVMNLKIDKSPPVKYGGVLITWWILYIITSILGQIIFRMDEGQTIPELLDYTLICVVDGIITIPSGVLLLWLIKKYGVQETSLANLEAAEHSEFSLSEEAELLP